MTDSSEFPAIRRLIEARSPQERVPEGVDALAAGVDRGHHLALIAAEGARLCRLYSAAAIQDLADHEEARALILVATPDRGRRLARSIERFGHACGWETVLWSSGNGPKGAAVPSRCVLVSTPSNLLAAVRAGDVALGDVRLFVLDDVAALAEEWVAVDSLLQSIEGEVRRIAVTHRRDAEFDGLLERLLPRARRWPRELFDLDAGERPAREGPPVRYATAGTHDDRLLLLVDMLRDWATDQGLAGVRVWCADEAAASGVAAALAVEGIATGDGGVRVRPFEVAGDEPAGPGAPAVAFGLPWTAEELVATLGPATKRAAIIEPRHGRQMEILAERAGWPVRPLPGKPRTDPGDLGAFRAHIEDAIESQDLATGTLLIAPLVETHGYERVSAALAGLLRAARSGGGGSEEPAGTTGPTSPGAAGGGGRPGVTASPDARRASAPAWSKVWVNVGRQDGAAPGDFVGAITGETGAAGAQIGKIDIRQKFSLIDIDSMIVDTVIQSMTGKQIKGRDVVARLDRSG
jgi:ATP-dependent RNA helicase DeaD